MPSSPYVINGTVRKGPFQGITTISATVGSGGGDTIDIYVCEGSELAQSQVVVIKHTASSETLTATTNSLGQYNIDLADLSSYSIADAFTVTVDTRTSKILDNQSISKVVMVDRTEKIHDEVYPLPVRVVEGLSGHPTVIGNVDTSWVITRSDGQPDSETVTFPDGTAYIRTFGYNASNRLTSRSKWQKV